MPEKFFEEGKSSKEIAKEMLKHGTSSPESIQMRNLLQYKQQKELVDQTRWLVIATWILVVSTVSVQLILANSS